MIALICSVTSPVLLTDATPSTASKDGAILSLINSDNSVLLNLSESIAVTITGIISGFNFMIVGLPTSSDQ